MEGGLQHRETAQLVAIPNACGGQADALSQSCLTFGWSRKWGASQCIFIATAGATYLSVTTSMYAPVPQDSALVIAASNSSQVVAFAVNQPLQPKACGSW